MDESCHICILLSLLLLTVASALKSTAESAAWMILDEMIAVLSLFLEWDQIPVLAGRQAAQYISVEFYICFCSHW